MEKTYKDFLKRLKKNHVEEQYKCHGVECKVRRRYVHRKML